MIPSRHGRARVCAEGQQQTEVVRGGREPPTARTSCDCSTPVVAERGLDLEDVQVTPAGKRRLLRVVVDQDGGVGLDSVATVSTAVAAALDDSDVMGGSPYVLEVTSPGVDRPLTQPRHWRRARSRLVEATVAEDGSRDRPGRRRRGRRRRCSTSTASSA